MKLPELPTNSGSYPISRQTESIGLPRKPVEPLHVRDHQRAESPRPVLEYRAVVVGDYYESPEGFPLADEIRLLKAQLGRGPINMAVLCYVLDACEELAAREAKAS